jgi:chromosome segregation ATPase
MATKRTLSLTKQLKAAQTELAEHKAHSEKLAKDLESKKSNYDYQYNQTQLLQREIDQVHSFLDAIPNPPAREADGEYTKVKHALMTRLSVFLATR